MITTNASHRIGLCPRRLWVPTLCLGLSLVLAALSAHAAPQRASGNNDVDWLEMRRKGARGVACAAAEHATARAWQASFVMQGKTLVGADGAMKPLPSGGAKPAAGRAPAGGLAGLRLTIARRPAKPGPVCKRAGEALLVRFDAPASVRGAGVLIVDEQAWVRLPGDKRATPANNDRLGQIDPKLGLPMQLFAIAELAARFDAEMESEGGDTAILRLRPGYAQPGGLHKAKLGVSKRYLVPGMTEINDRKGKLVANLVWTDFEQRDGAWVPDLLRLLRAVDGGGAIVLKRDQKATLLGDKVKVEFTAAELR